MVQLSTEVGTITTGTWQGTKITDSFIDLLQYGIINKMN